MRPNMRAASLAAGALCIALSASACAGAGGGSAAVMAGGRNAATLSSGSPVTVRLEEPSTITVERE